MKTVVKWGNSRSYYFTILQGVRQGGTLSTDQYKRYNNALLDWINDLGISAKIGAIACAAPTCADDAAIAANSREELQILLHMASIYSSMERFQIQPAKSMIIAMNTATPEILLMEDSPWQLGTTKILVVSIASHLGIQHDAHTLGVRPTIEQNIKKLGESCMPLWELASTARMA